MRILKLLTALTALLPFLLTNDVAAQSSKEIHQADISHDSYNLLWPSWVFGHWIWEGESTMGSALQIVDDYLAHDIPVSAIIIDSPWETDYNTFVWDTALFADPQGMIDSLHARNVKVLLWITGIVNVDAQPLYDYAASQDYFMKQLPFDSDPAVINWWKGDGSLIDYYNPDAVDWWKGLMDQALAYGIDGWKCDGTDFSEVQCPWSPGADNFISRTDYSDKYYRLHFDHMREVLGNDRVITARPVDNYALADIGGSQVAFSPVDINFCGWVGDQDPTFEGLVFALNNMYHSSEMGYLSHGSDIGGYREMDSVPNGRTKELFIRWAQLGTFSGLMENGGSGEHRPWMFDQETQDIYHDLVQKRYSMTDYLMTNSDTFYQQGLPMMDFFNKTDYSYMFGPDLFVAPFLNEGTSITVNFPDGANWIYLYDYSQVYQGGTQADLVVTYTEYPVFFRAGTAPLGISGNEEFSNVTFYPNPTSGELTIDAGNGFAESSSVTLYDCLGTRIMKRSMKGSRMKIDLSGRAKGIYYCTIRCDDGSSTVNRKIVVQ